MVDLTERFRDAWMDESTRTLTLRRHPPRLACVCDVAWTRLLGENSSLAARVSVVPESRRGQLSIFQEFATEPGSLSLCLKRRRSARRPSLHSLLHRGGVLLMPEPNPRKNRAEGD